MLRSTRLPLVVLVALWAALYLPHVLAGHTLPARDLAATFLPWRQVWRTQVLAGHLPLWDPSSNHGRPLLANPDQMAAYPGSVLFLLLPPESAVVWHAALHHLLFLLGTYCLARRCGAGAPGAAVGAAAASTSGVAFSTMAFLPAPAALAWAPWALVTAAAPPATPMRALRSSLVGGALLGLCFLAGEPVTAGLAAIAWVVLVLSTWPRRLWWGVPAAGVAAFAVAAPQLVPLLMVFPDTTRGALGVGPGELQADTLALRRLPELLFPYLLGEPLGDGRGGFWAATSFPFQRYYPVIFLGTLPLMVLPFALRARRRLLPWWLLLAAGVLSSAALSSRIVEVTAQGLPLLRSARYGIKLLILPTLALAPLVAAGFERLVSLWRTHRTSLRVGLLAAAAMLGVRLVLPVAAARTFLGTMYPRSRADLAALDNRSLRRAALLDGATTLAPLVMLVVAGPAPTLTAAVLAVANTVGGAGVLLFEDARRWAQPPPLLNALPRAPTVSVLVSGARPASQPEHTVLRRFWYPRAALVPNYGTRWGVSYVLDDGPNGLEPLRHELLAAAAVRLSNAERARIAQALGAQAVIAGSPIERWRTTSVDGIWVNLSEHSAPPAYLARRLLPAKDLMAAALVLANAGFRPGEDAVVEGIGAARELAGGRVTELEGVPHCRRWTVQAEGPALLVIQQSFMRCWRATVDGRPTPVGPVNGASLAVAVPAGSHTVSVFLDPIPYRFALLAPWAVIGTLLAVLAADARRRSAPQAQKDRHTPIAGAT